MKISTVAGRGHKKNFNLFIYFVLMISDEDFYGGRTGPLEKFYTEHCMQCWSYQTYRDYRQYYYGADENFGWLRRGWKFRMMKISRRFL